MITFFLLGKRASIPDSKQKGKEMKKLKELNEIGNLCSSSVMS